MRTACHKPQLYLHHPYLCRLDLTKSVQDVGEGCGLQHIQGMATCSRTIPHSPHCLLMLLILCVADVSLHRITLRLSFVPNGLESITHAQTHWLGPTRSVICRSAFESAQRAQRDFRMIQFELASEINDVQAADTVEFAKTGPRNCHYQWLLSCCTTPPATPALEPAYLYLNSLFNYHGVLDEV